MRQRMQWCLLLSLVVMPVALWADSTTQKTRHPTFSAADVASINKQMHALVDEKSAATGIVTLIMQGGKQIDLDAYGVADVERHTPMRTNSVMSIASMTKPVTGVALMMLYEQGKWSLDDPIAKFIPELKDLKVMRSDGTLVPPHHAPTMRELMSHSAGFTYGEFGDSAVDKLVKQANVLDSNSTLKAAMGKIAKLPLKHQPGTQWEYSISVDIQGYIIEKLSGVPYDVYVREHIIKPLKLKDTDFAVLSAARERIAYIHSRDKNGAFAIQLWGGKREDFASKIPSLPMPGGGLFSSAEDYARFCQMLLNGGTIDGVRILKPETVRLMHQNVLPKGLHVAIGSNDLRGTGFGLDFAVVEDAVGGGEPVPNGTYYWSGIHGTYFWIDPRNDIVVVGMIQRDYSPATDRTFDPVYVRNEAGKIIYAALNDSQ